jgi:hypothetical protein
VLQHPLSNDIISHLSSHNPLSTTKVIFLKTQMSPSCLNTPKAAHFSMNKIKSILPLYCYMIHSLTHLTSLFPPVP